MPDFTLDTSTLAGGQFQTAPFEMNGEFREVQFHFTQAGASEDLEIHWFEFHYAIAGVSHESI